MQPDRGRVCAYWAAVLVAGMQDKAVLTGTSYPAAEARTAAVHAAKFQCMALRHLVHAAYMYTGEVIPQPLRASLVIALSAKTDALMRAIWNRDPAIVHALDDTRLLHCACLLELLATDKAFAANNGDVRRAINLLQSRHFLATGDDTYFECVYECLGRAHMKAVHETPRVEIKDALVFKGGVWVRGSGLAASAYGMLHCPAAVHELLAKWQCGPWAGRLVPFKDFIVSFDPHREKAPGVEHPQGRLAVGELPAEITLMKLRCSAEGLQCLLSLLRFLKPRVPGGGRAAFVLSQMMLPDRVWHWHGCDGLEHLGVRAELLPPSDLARLFAGYMQGVSASARSQFDLKAGNKAAERGASMMLFSGDRVSYFSA